MEDRQFSLNLQLAAARAQVISVPRTSSPLNWSVVAASPQGRDILSVKERIRLERERTRAEAVGLGMGREKESQLARALARSEAEKNILEETYCWYTSKRPHNERDENHLKNI